MIHVRGKIIKLRLNDTVPKLDYKILRKLLPLSEELQKMYRSANDESDEMSSLVTRHLSKYKSLLDITDEEVDMYLEALVFEEA
jgi:hypothetical protein